MPVDLHSHSRVSDGSDSPAELVANAVRARVSALALTDHDTQDGIAEARAAARAAGMELVPGAEISCGNGVHLVVLFLEPGPGPLQDRLGEIREGRASRNRRIVERLGHLGIELTLDEVMTEAGEGVVGRPHFAAVLVRKGVVPDHQAAFDEYLAGGRPAYVPRDTLGIVEAAGLARDSGAVPILAHPHTITDDLNPFLERAAAAGLAGIEVLYPGYDAARRRELTVLADRHGLSISGGSDYHGSYKPTIKLGKGTGDLHVPESVLDELRSRAG